MKRPNITLVDARSRSTFKVSTAINSDEVFALLFHHEQVAIEYAAHSEDGINWVPVEIVDDLCGWAKHLQETRSITGVYEDFGGGLFNSTPIETFLMIRRRSVE